MPLLLGVKDLLKLVLNLPEYTADQKDDDDEDDGGDSNLHAGELYVAGDNFLHTLDLRGDEAENQCLWYESDHRSNDERCQFDFSSREQVRLDHFVGEGSKPHEYGHFNALCFERGL